MVMESHPRAITTHHVLKLIALLAMTADHIGAFLYPEQLWWRVSGRVALPIFIFLIGHAPQHPVRRDMLLWAGMLFVANPFLGKGLLPANILLTIACAQLIVRYVEHRRVLDREAWTVLIASFLFFLPSVVLMEYGTIGFLYALMGYAVRAKKMDWRRGKLISMAALMGYLLLQVQAYPYSSIQLVVMTLLVSVVTFYLARFTYRPVMGIPKPVARATLFWSHYSMQYYVVHRILLQAAGVTKGILNPALRLI